jgi:diguanylate cyclase (GGDEF)-like protein/PAS domain S-box-containing protein
MKSSVSWLTGNGPDAECSDAEVEGSAEAESATVLIVDDDARLRHSVRDLLLAYGFRCHSADSGGQALEMLSEREIDIMLLDLNMPGMDGQQVMVQAAERFPETAVIVLSGETTFESATEALRRGALDFLRKPCAPDELYRVLNSVLHKRDLEHEVQVMQRRLEASEQRYRFIVDNSPDIIYMLDEKGRFSFVNERIGSLLGYSREELLGRHHLGLVHPEDREKARFAFAERRTGRRASTNVELRLLCHDRRLPYRHLESRSIPVELSAIGIYSDSKDGVYRGTYGVLRDISERKRAEELITFQLHHDLLTKLPNRALFQDRLELALSRARRNQSLLAVMYLDMDRFKVINDSLGHLAGDRLLQVVASRLRSCLRGSDTLARVGGDEFNLLLPDIAGRDDAAMIARKILDQLKAPVVIDGYEVFVSFSIGIALYPEDGKSMNELVKNADMAMYHIKGRGKNGFEFFSDNMKGIFRQQATIESGIRTALKERQFELYFQPQVDICSGRVWGMEALIRWHHPERGVILPDEFVPVAEETGLITEIGDWVLEEACRELREWQRGGFPEAVLAINLSAAQLVQADFESGILEALKRNGLSGDRLELEITENVLMQEMDQAASRLQLLAAQGVRIAVDDFGIGYSSLGYLQALPLHTLKIDRSFISDIQSPDDRSSIVTAIFAMARELELEVVAEGVENEEQAAYLRRLHCSRAQGFLLGYPVTAEKARALLQR